MKRVMLMLSLLATFGAALGLGVAGATSLCGDSIEGAIGDNRLTGDRFGPCFDTIIGKAGDDTIRGVLLSDTLYGGSDADTLYGGRGGDETHGGGGRDTIYGEDGSDTMWGGTYGDLIHGGSGRDRLYGGRGNDTIDAQDLSDEGPLGRDVIDCGPGQDIAVMDAVDNEQPRNCEKYVIGID